MVRVDTSQSLILFFLARRCGQAAGRRDHKCVGRKGGGGGPHDGATVYSSTTAFRDLDERRSERFSPDAFVGRTVTTTSSPLFPV